MLWQIVAISFNVQTSTFTFDVKPLDGHGRVSPWAYAAARQAQADYDFIRGTEAGEQLWQDTGGSLLAAFNAEGGAAPRCAPSGHSTAEPTCGCP